MLSIKLLNQEASINNFFYVGHIEYVPGEAFKVNIQLINKEINQRLIPDNLATVDIIFQKTDGTELTKVATKIFGADDKSAWKVSLSAVESSTIIGSNFKVKVTAYDGTNNASAIAYNVLQRNSFDGAC